MRGNSRRPYDDVTTPALPVRPALLERLSGRPLVLLLDVDGTLSPIASRPQSAIVPSVTRRVLERLVELPDVHLVLMSGRSALDAARLVSIDGAWTIGNHGLEVAAPGAPPSPRDDVAPFAERITAAAERLGDVLSDFDGVTVEDKRWTLSVHYRLVERREVGGLQAKVAEVARHTGLLVTLGKEVIELRPPVNADKGTASLEFADRLGAFQDGASLLCAGDDRTDEDAFVALRGVRPGFVTVRVRERANDDSPRTAAEFEVSDPDEFRRLLELVAERRESAAVS
jgi:trehalose-phosphatase